MNSAAAEAQRRGSAHPKNGQLPVEVPKNGPVSTASMACDYWLLEGYAGPCGIPNVPQPSHFTLYRERQLLFRPFGSAVVVKPAQCGHYQGPRNAKSPSPPRRNHGVARRVGRQVHRVHRTVRHSGAAAIPKTANCPWRCQKMAQSARRPWHVTTGCWERPPPATGPWPTSRVSLVQRMARSRFES